MAHACHAGLQQEAVIKVYHERILRLEEHYSIDKLGALGSDLGAVACFFEQPWSRVSPAFTENVQTWLLNEAAMRLCALGRLTEALEPMRVSSEIDVKMNDWKNAAISYSNLSAMELTLGQVDGAVGDAERSVIYADRSGVEFERMSLRAGHAHALHQAARWAEAEALFRAAEELQTERDPRFPLLYSRQGFLYCELLLAAPERAAWQRTLCQDSSDIAHPSSLAQSCQAVLQRAAMMLNRRQPDAALLNIALEHLTLGRAALYEAMLERSSFNTCQLSLQNAVVRLRRSGWQDHLPLGLLTRAWLRSRTGARTGAESAYADLNEAWEIAERGPMPLFLVDIHLHRARLFGDRMSAPSGEQYPWESPAADLAEARRLILKHSYLRRMEELEDADSGKKLAGLYAIGAQSDGCMCGPAFAIVRHLGHLGSQRFRCVHLGASW